MSGDRVRFFALLPSGLGALVFYLTALALKDSVPGIYFNPVFYLTTLEFVLQFSIVAFAGSFIMIVSFDVVLPLLAITIGVFEAAAESEDLNLLEVLETSDYPTAVA